MIVGLAAAMTVLCMALVINAEAPWETMDEMELDSLTLDVAVEGDVALVASGKAGVYTIDISDPATMVIMSRFDTPDDAVAVELLGNIGFVADHRTGLLILNLQDPEQPELISSLALPGPARDVAVQTSYCYIATDGEGLVVVDIANLEEPMVVSNLSLKARVLNLDLQGSLAILALGEEGVAVIDISDPLQPQMRSQWSDEHPTLTSTLINGYGYLAQGSAGLRVLDLSDPSHPQPVGQLAVDDEVRGITGVGNYLYLALYRDGLGLARADDPAHPLWLAGLESEGYGLAIAAREDTVFLANGPAGLLVARALPMASINHIDPNPAVHNEKVELKGNGLGYTLVSSYRWYSDLDGLIGDMPSLELYTLSLGHHTISLQVADSSGHWSQPATRELIVTLRPTATIQSEVPALINEGQELNVEGSGADDGPIRAYQWQFGGHEPFCHERECTLADLTPGHYILYFRVQDSTGLWSNPDSVSFRVNGRPTATLLGVDTTVTDGVSPLGDPVVLRSAGTDDGNLTTLIFSWSSDIQGFLGYGDNLTVTDLMKGYHRLTLLAEDELGAISNPRTTSLLVAQRPQSSIITRPADVVPLGSAVELAGTGEPVEEVAGYTWTSNRSGLLSSLPEIILDDLAPGYHEITFLVHSVQGIPSHPLTFNLLVNQPPEAEILLVDPNPALAGETITLKGEGWDSEGTITAHRWEHGDGRLLGLAPDLIIALEAGNHELFYQVRDQHGAWSLPSTVKITVVSLLLDQVVHMAPVQAEMEDGSQQFPFSNLSMALGVAQDDWTILIHGGEYTGSWILDRPLTIKGLEGATLVPEAGSTALTITSEGVNLSGLRFESDGGGNGLLVLSDGSVLEGLTFQGLHLGLCTRGTIPQSIGNLTFLENELGWSMEEASGQVTALGLVFRSNDIGLKVVESEGLDLGIHDSFFEQNRNLAIDSDIPVNASSNWWGDGSGPFIIETNPDGEGDPLSDTVTYRPWISKIKLPSIIIRVFERSILDDGTIIFSWQTDRAVLTSLVVTSGGIKTTYPGNSTASRYHEITIMGLDPDKPYEVQVVGQDETGESFSGGSKIYLTPTSNLSAHPFGVSYLAEIMSGLLIIGVGAIVLQQKANRGQGSYSIFMDVVELDEGKGQLVSDLVDDEDEMSGPSDPDTTQGIGKISTGERMVSLMDPLAEEDLPTPLPSAQAIEILNDRYEGSASIATNKDGEGAQTSIGLPRNMTLVDDYWEEQTVIFDDPEVPDPDELGESMSEMPREEDGETDASHIESDIGEALPGQDAKVIQNGEMQDEPEAPAEDVAGPFMRPLEAFLTFQETDPNLYTSDDYPPIDHNDSDFVNGLLQMSEQGCPGRGLPPGTGVDEDAPPMRQAKDRAPPASGYTLDAERVPVSEILEGIEQMGGELGRLRWQNPLSSLDNMPSLALELKRSEDELIQKEHAEKLSQKAGASTKTAIETDDNSSPSDPGSGEQPVLEAIPIPEAATDGVEEDGDQDRKAGGKDLTIPDNANLEASTPPFEDQRQASVGELVDWSDAIEEEIPEDNVGRPAPA